MKPVIVVRSYQRSHMILGMTLGELAKQKDIDLARQLVLVVSDKAELDRYRRVLKDYPLRDIWVSGVGGHVATNYAVDHLPEGEPVIFMDDDIESLRIYTDVQKETVVPLVNMGRLHRYIFERMTESDIFNVDFMATKREICTRPFFQLLSRDTCGTWWGGFNTKEFKTEQSHDDDNIRTARALHRHGAVYVVNWITGHTRWGLNPGGMQASGDRGTDRLAITLQHCKEEWKIPEVRKYFGETPLVHNDMHSLKVLRPGLLQQVLGSRYRDKRWSEYFQDLPDSGVVCQHGRSILECGLTHTPLRDTFCSTLL